jgi:iron(III) transport system permease protein
MDGWRLAVTAIAGLVAVPLLVIISSLLKPTQGIWDHLVANVLPGILTNTAWLVFGVSLGTFVLGTSLGWLTGVCDFPGRKMFSWALLLPLAMPAYVLAFIYLGLLDFSGPVQEAFRTHFPQSGLSFPDIRSTAGVITVMILALYPYVYMFARSAFMTQGKSSWEAARTLGLTPTAAFFRVCLPMARPWIAGGLMLVVMETLADFGAVSIFNFDTFTTVIYKAWFGFFSITAAAQLSSILVFIVFLVILLEHLSRSRMRYTQGGSCGLESGRIKLVGGFAWAAFWFSLFVLLGAFVFPCIQLLLWAVEVFHLEFVNRYFWLVGRTLFLASTAALVICFVSMVLAYAKRRHKDHYTSGLTRVATLGYALPGTVLAVGIFIPVTRLDSVVVHWMNSFFDYEAPTFLQGTLIIMFTAYLVRFMITGFNPLDCAAQRITPSIDEASRLMGVKGFSLLRHIHIPMLRNGLLTAVILVFVEVMKEMPITLMTRPFGWDTLAVKIFELTSEGEWERSALPALALVLAGLVPVILLMRESERNSLGNRENATYSRS